MKVVVISGSPRKNANTQIMMKHVFDYTKQKDVDVKFINLSEGGFEYYRGFLNEIDYNEKTLQAAKDITEADVWLIGTPIYNSMFSAALKNLFEFVNLSQQFLEHQFLLAEQRFLLVRHQFLLLKII